MNNTNKMCDHISFVGKRFIHPAVGTDCVVSSWNTLVFMVYWLNSVRSLSRGARSQPAWLLPLPPSCWSAARWLRDGIPFRDQRFFTQVSQGGCLGHSGVYGVSGSHKGFRQVEVRTAGGPLRPLHPLVLEVVRDNPWG